jgi:hypothetical protein
LVKDPPKFPEIRQGWYHQNGEWFLTWDALKDAFETTKKKIAEITVTTRKGGVKEGRLRTTIGRNKYNNKAFVLYSLDDMTMLWQERESLLLQEDMDTL